MLVSAFSSLKFKFDFKPKVDNVVFLLHYRYTYTLFMAGVLLTTLYDWVGNSIECLIDSGSDQLQDVVNSWCFIMGTFTVKKHLGAEVGKEVPFPGVGPHSDNDEIIVHSYYQWVPFVLFFQGVAFYLPHWVWKRWEGGLFRNVIMDLSLKDYLGNNLKTFEERNQRFQKLAMYLKGHLGSNSFWAFKFFACEAANLVVAAVVFCSIDAFLGGEFTTYGTEVFEFLGEAPENRTDPMREVFPRMAKCTFQKFGPSGTVEITDVMCLIPTNVVNEKIYVAIWLWLVILMVVTSCWLVLRLITVFVPAVRLRLLKVRCPYSSPSEASSVLSQADLSDWFLLLNLGKNMERTIFSEFVSYLAEELKSEPFTADSVPLNRLN